MKKIVLVLVAAVVSLSASAQGDWFNDFNYGVKAGLNISNVSNLNESARLKYHVGLSAEYVFDSIFSLQPEVVLSFQGSRSTSSTADVDFVHKTNLTYLNIPIMAKACVLDGLTIEAGPQIGFCLSARSKNKSTVGSTTDKTVSDLNNVKTVDFAFALGTTYMFATDMGVQARYNIGLSDIIKDNAGDKCRNNVFQLGVVYLF